MSERYMRENERKQDCLLETQAEGNRGYLWWESFTGEGQCAIYD